MGAMRSSLCRISASGRPTPTATIAVALGTPAAALVRRAGDLALGPRRPPVARRLRPIEDGIVPSESRIVFRASVARR
jgi:hypothetical protein